jgi:hypothetical protein
MPTAQNTQNTAIIPRHLFEKPENLPKDSKISKEAQPPDRFPTCRRFSSAASSLQPSFSAVFFQ